MNKCLDLLIKNVQRLIKLKGWNQSELARRMDTDPSHLSYWFTGKRAPGLEKLDLMAKALDVPITSLFVEEDAIPESIHTIEICLPVIIREMEEAQKFKDIESIPYMRDIIHHALSVTDDESRALLAAHIQHFIEASSKLATLKPFKK